MNHDKNKSNTRRSHRERESSAVLWKRCDQKEFDMGWLLEQSEVGCAYAWRGSTSPEPGTHVTLRLDCASEEGDEIRGIVRRVLHAHDDLVVLGVEYLTATILAQAQTVSDITVVMKEPASHPIERAAA